MVLETERLRLRQLVAGDAAFILELVNDPVWLQHIGDKNVHSLEDARRYIDTGPGAMYVKHGFGLYLTSLKDGDIPIGLCGLLKRDALTDVDIGFALLPQYRAHGYAYEAASATLAYGRRRFGLRRILAITTPDNHDSAKLLRRLGMRFEGSITLGADSDAKPLSLYLSDADDRTD